MIFLVRAILLARLILLVQAILLARMILWVQLGCPDSSSRKIRLSNSMFRLFARNLISEESYWSGQRNGLLVLRKDLVFRQYVALTMKAITRNAYCFATIWTFDVLLLVITNKEHPFKVLITFIRCSNITVHYAQR